MWPPWKRMQRCGARTDCFEERCGRRCGSPGRGYKVWCKKRLLGRKVWQQMWLPGRGSQGVVQKLGAWKKGVVADMAPLEEDAKVWSKKRLLRRKVW